MYFYELHEGDDDFIDALLAHEDEFDETQFLELVLESRAEVLGTYEEDTLVEAVANDLERRHGFLYIHDGRLRAAVNVSADEAGTFNALIEQTGNDEDDEDDADAGDGYRSVMVELDREGRQRF